MSKVDLWRCGREWAWLAERHGIEPPNYGNIEHDRACAEEYLRRTGKAPSWYSADHHGPIAPKDQPRLCI